MTDYNTSSITDIAKTVAGLGNVRPRTKADYGNFVKVGEDYKISEISEAKSKDGDKNVISLDAVSKEEAEWDYAPTHEDMFSEKETKSKTVVAMDKEGASYSAMKMTDSYMNKGLKFIQSNNGEQKTTEVKFDENMDMSDLKAVRYAAERQLKGEEKQNISAFFKNYVTENEGEYKRYVLSNMRHNAGEKVLNGLVKGAVGVLDGVGTVVGALLSDEPSPMGKAVAEDMVRFTTANHFGPIAGSAAAKAFRDKRGR